eukprot:GHRR01030582.1.p1 GENE.GHRR01030582.1~~GHRR01030582.1.p1  ORF type:complete len:491 (+),score=126.44 GHRR01030582.1:556-2028(+)
MFNISNLDAVRKGAKPILEQVGPYVHRAYHERHEVLWSDNGRVHFKDYTYFVLDENLTTADLHAPIATLNLPLLGVLANLHEHVSPSLAPWVDLLTQMIARYQGDPDVRGLFTVKPAVQLLWGYEDRLLALLARILPPGTLPHGAMFALMNNMSGLQEALSQEPNVFNTGALDITQVWNIEADHGRTAVTSWPCPEPVRGSDAMQFRPGLTEKDRLTVFIGDIFQAADLIVNSTVDLHGVKLLRYWLDPAQAEPNPCHNMDIRGLINITGPQAGGFTGRANASGPYIFISMPMFCGVDDRLVQDVEGLRCDWEKHMTWIDVEPTTGVTMRAYKRLMLSSRLGPLGSVLEPGVAGNLTIPMFWAEETGQLTHDLARQFKSSVYRAQWFIANLGKMCWILGGSLILIGILLAVLTVELASDPDKWPGQPASDVVVLAAARDMLSVRVDGGGLPVSSSAGASENSSEGVTTANVERRPLLQPVGPGSEIVSAE